MKLKRVISYILFNGFLAAMLYMALIKNIECAKNVAIVLIWLNALMSSVSLTDEFQKVMAKIGRQIPAWIDNTFDWTIIIVLLWHGWIASGIAHLFHNIIVQVAWSRIKKTDE